MVGEYEVAISYKDEDDGFLEFFNYGEHYVRRFYLCIFHNSDHLMNPIEALCPLTHDQRDRNDPDIQPTLVPYVGSCKFMNVNMAQTLSVTVPHTF